jgi:hypothetical protein
MGARILKWAQVLFGLWEGFPAEGSGSADPNRQTNPTAWLSGLFCNIPSRAKGRQWMKLLGVLLIVAGIAGVVYGGFTYTSQKKAVDMGPIQIDKTEHHTVPIPPLLGVIGIVAGGLLLYSGGRSGSSL